MGALSTLPSATGVHAAQRRQRAPGVRKHKTGAIFHTAQGGALGPEERHARQHQRQERRVVDDAPLAVKLQGQGLLQDAVRAAKRLQAAVAVGGGLGTCVSYSSAP